MKQPDVARQRLLTQHACGDPLGSAVEVVRSLLAVQAQDYRGGLWAVGLRTRDAVEATVEKALADGSIIRTWPMRGTLHLVAAEDARWMLRLLTPRVAARIAGRHRQLELDRAVFLRARKVFEKALRGGGPRTRDEMYGLLGDAGISPSGQRGIHILQMLSQDEVLCFGPRKGRQQTFVLLDEWVPVQKPRPRDEALGHLALRYFAGHGPATVRDFAWWTGLTLADAKAGVHAVEAQLSSDGGLYSASSRAPSRGALRPAALLLPPFDELLVAYKDRDASLDPAHAGHIGNLLSPTIAVRGAIAGTWTRTLARNRVTIHPRYFAPLGERDAAAVTAAARRYGAFVGAAAELA